ncbi:MAG TPA: 3-hydroxyacyl-CoA dehydrogenase family protein, partial [Trueperaceae bacterium]
GPFELLDLIGIDVNLAASESVYRAFYEEPRFRPHPLQRAMVEAGLLGRKTGRGFYTYDDGGDRTGRAPDAHGSSGSSPRERGADVAGRAPLRLGTTPAFHVVGEGSVAAALRAALPLTADPAAASLVLDARLDAPAGDGVTHRAVLTWGHSAAAAREKLGFSLVPVPGGGPLTVELMAAGSLPGEQPAPVVEAARVALEAAGASVVMLPDIPGGAAFRVVARLFDEAVRALTEGLATAAELDLAMRLGVNYPAGPLEWGEALGLRDVHAALRSLQDETSDARFAPHPWLARLAALGARRLPRGTMEGEET